MLCKWEELPKFMRISEVRNYYQRLSKRRFSLLIKRTFDFVISSILLVFFVPIFLFLAVCIKLDSPGPVFYRQERVTQYGRIFRIYKFRTMIQDADKMGSLVTVNGDDRITKVGKWLRRYRLDEFPQLINIWKGEMTFVGTRPEVLKYVKKYTPEMRATLLLPAGITSRSSICYKDEANLFNGEDDVDKVYMEQILPEKMKMNIEAINNFSLFKELWIMVDTVLTVFGKNED